ncbi:hypothetical protein [Phaffia rhodozyma]|uniref:Uncharacterized protein n=1 Tax=Phaffia rhodozyma TaxID=264483 RepID=A0A0F7SKK0_PHARH|nr:hypothetical protein [Phaffia rhodozyma]
MVIIRKQKKTANTILESAQRAELIQVAGPAERCFVKSQETGRAILASPTI